MTKLGWFYVFCAYVAGSVVAGLIKHAVGL